MRDRPEGASIYSIVWHYGITQSSFRKATARTGDFTESDIKRREMGLMVFSLDYVLLRTTITTMGGTPWSTIPGYYVLLYGAAPFIMEALRARRSTVIRPHDDVIFTVQQI